VKKALVELPEGVGRALDPEPIGKLEFADGAITLDDGAVKPVDNGMGTFVENVGIVLAVPPVESGIVGYALDPVPTAALELAETVEIAKEAVPPVESGTVIYVEVVGIALDLVPTNTLEFTEGEKLELEPVPTGKLVLAVERGIKEEPVK
jgi:hypothetical protein